MRRPQLRRLLTILATVLVAVPFAATPAHATGLPSISIYFMPHSTQIATEHEWCALGQASAGVTLWTVTVVAWRSDGSTYAPEPESFSTPRLNEYCVVFPKLGTSGGGVKMAVSYEGTGDLPLTAVAASTWLLGNDRYKDWHN